MKILFYSVFFIGSILSSFAMVPTIVPNAESLFIRQETPVWCWAATSSALHNYYNPQNIITQSEIAENNPMAKDTVVVPYFNPVEFTLPAGYDYLVDSILSSEHYQGYLKYFSVSKAIQLLKTGNPFMLSQNNHVTIVYGYFQIQETTFFLIYDPNAENYGMNPFLYAGQDNLVNIAGDPFGTMLFIKPKSEAIAKHISPMWD